jgi:hypothetical protein
MTNSNVEQIIGQILSRVSKEEITGSIAQTLAQIDTDLFAVKHLAQIEGVLLPSSRDRLVAAIDVFHEETSAVADAEVDKLIAEGFGLDV